MRFLKAPTDAYIASKAKAPQGAYLLGGILNDNHKGFREELDKRGIEYETEADDTVFTDDRNYRWLVSDMPSMGGDNLAVMVAGISCEEAADVIFGDVGRVSEDDDIAVLGFDTRVFNALKRAGVHTVGDLVGKRRSDIASLRGIGQLTVSEIAHVLERFGLALGDA